VGIVAVDAAEFCVAGTELGVGEFDRVPGRESSGVDGSFAGVVATAGPVEVGVCPAVVECLFGGAVDDEFGCGGEEAGSDLGVVGVFPAAEVAGFAADSQRDGLFCGGEFLHPL
jgi:hypothetical protein